MNSHLPFPPSDSTHSKRGCVEEAFLTNAVARVSKIVDVLLAVRQRLQWTQPSLALQPAFFASHATGGIISNLTVLSMRGFVALLRVLRQSKSAMCAANGARQCPS